MQKLRRDMSSRANLEAAQQRQQLQQRSGEVILPRERGMSLGIIRKPTVLSSEEHDDDDDDDQWKPHYAEHSVLYAAFTPSILHAHLLERIKSEKIDHARRRTEANDGTGLGAFLVQQQAKSKPLEPMTFGVNGTVTL
jgi:hypothetical protein